MHTHTSDKGQFISKETDRHMAVEGSPALALPSFSQLAFVDVHDLGFASRVVALLCFTGVPVSGQQGPSLKAHRFQLFPRVLPE